MRLRLPARMVVTAALTVIAAAFAPWASAQTRGLMAASDALGGPVWQARFERDTSALPALRGLSAWLTSSSPSQSLRLLGDYQFSALRLGETGGLRLTGGLLLNLRPVSPGALTGAGLWAQPYAGVGFASGSLDGRWGFSADLGLAANGLSPARLERPATALAADSQPRLLPLMRLGMTLAF